jgi:dihydrolipoamide dehydrogenase
MTTHRCDVAIIGAGTAGMGAYRAATAHGANTLLIEGGVYGTTCARVGCMPSKLLIAAANAAHGAREAEGFGVQVPEVRVDGPAVMRRVQAERDRFVGFVVATVEGWPQAHRLHASARFEAPGVLALSNGHRVEASRVVIATGSTPQLPGALAVLPRERVDTNDSIFEWLDLPESVAVFGTGVIGLELGQALHRLGVRVRIFGRSQRIAGISDPEVATKARKELGAELMLTLESELLDIRDEGEAFTVRWRDAEGEHSERFTRVLAASGRSPNVDGLNLEAAGVPLDDQGLPRFDRLTGQCGEAPVFIAGDASGEVPLLHEASDEGRIAGDNAGRWPDVQPGHRRTPLSVVFSEPQVVALGQSFRTLCESDADFAVGQVDFAGQGRARVIRENAGLLRVYGDHESGRLLGAEIIGPRAEHIGHLLAWAVQAGLTVDDALAMPFYHPVIEEGLRTALRDLAHALKKGPAPVPGCDIEGPGG